MSKPTMSGNLPNFLFPFWTNEIKNVCQAMNDAFSTEWHRGNATMQKALFSENAMMATPMAAMQVAMNWMSLPQKIMALRSPVEEEQREAASS